LLFIVFFVSTLRSAEIPNGALDHRGWFVPSPELVNLANVYKDEFGEAGKLLQRYDDQKAAGFPIDSDGARTGIYRADSMLYVGLAHAELAQYYARLTSISAKTTPNEARIIGLWAHRWRESENVIAGMRMAFAISVENEGFDAHRYLIEGFLQGAVANKVAMQVAKSLILEWLNRDDERYWSKFGDGVLSDALGDMLKDGHIVAKIKQRSQRSAFFAQLSLSLPEE